MPTFRPAWWCKGSHAQTLWGAISGCSFPLPVHRQRLETPDGDFLDLDRIDEPAGSPVLVVLHGLEGSSQSSPVRRLMKQANKAGWRSVAMNFRSCSGVPNRLPRSYNAGETSDLAWVIQRLTKEEPAGSIFCVGFSLGGNVLLKYLGESPQAVPPQLRAAAAISTPFDLAACARGLERGFSKIYSRRLVAALKNKTQRKLKLHPRLLNLKLLLKVQTLEEFDNAVTAPLYGFKDADAYWSASSCLQFLPNIKTPTLLINSRDDPFFAGTLLPEKEAAENPMLEALFTEHGGHMGFISGIWPGWPAAWAEKEVLEFLKRFIGRGAS